MTPAHNPPLLIVFTRRPEPGRVKTRLIPVLGAEGAAALQRRMTVHTLMHARRAAWRYGLALEVHCAGGAPEDFHAWLGPDLNYRSQVEGDLGQRMAGAFASAFERGHASAVIIGTDCPRINEDVLRRALELLQQRELVLGPALDGGYYLIGLNRPCTQLFHGIAWGTESVLEETLRAAAAAGLAAGLLKPLPDIDRPEDLPAWEAVQRRQGQDDRLDRISIVIPALNEADRIAQTLAHAADEPGVELIVADGGSRDATRAIAESYGARVVQSPPGRARQMNAGAADASGEILVFLHADTLLPVGYGAAVRHALADPAVAGGAFRFALDERTPSLRLIAWGVNLRSRWLGLPYGDQALFLRAGTFRRLGGFPDRPIMEDVALVRALKRRGLLRLLEQPAITSARRWRALGPWRLTLLHLAALCGYGLGCSPQGIRAWLSRHGYDQRRRQDP